MKKLTLIFIFILSLPLAYAIYGGETWTYNFNKCDALEVEISGTQPIDDGEYHILNNCTLNDTNYYLCDCEDNYNFSVTFEPNAINHYTFSFTYITSEIIEEGQSSSGGGSSGGGKGVFTLRFTEKARTLMLKPFVYSRFWINGKQHTIRITRISNGSVDFEIKSNPIYLTLKEGNETTAELEGNVLNIKLKEIRARTAYVEFKILEEPKKKLEVRPIKKEVKINESKEPELIKDLNTKEELKEIQLEEQEEEKESTHIALIIWLIVVIVVVIGGYFYGKKMDYWG